jgi:hypothetical protein
MSTVRPTYLDIIDTEPMYKVDLEAFRREGATINQQKSIVEDIPYQQVRPQPAISQPKSSVRPVIEDKKVKDKVKPISKRKDSSPV